MENNEQYNKEFEDDFILRFSRQFGISQKDISIKYGHDRWEKLSQIKIYIKNKFLCNFYTTLKKCESNEVYNFYLIDWYIENRITKVCKLKKRTI